MDRALGPNGRKISLVQISTTVVNYIYAYFLIQYDFQSKKYKYAWTYKCNNILSPTAVNNL